MKGKKEVFQKMFKSYLKALLKETDFEKRDYIQHQLKTLMKLIKERQREE